MEASMSRNMSNHELNGSALKTFRQPTSDKSFERMDSKIYTPRDFVKHQIIQDGLVKKVEKLTKQVEKIAAHQEMTKVKKFPSIQRSHSHLHREESKSDQGENPAGGEKAKSLGNFLILVILIVWMSINVITGLPIIFSNNVELISAPYISIVTGIFCHAVVIRKFHFDPN